MPGNQPTDPGRGATGDALAPLVDRSVIHDLRNPLNAIGGNLQLLQMALESALDPRNRSRLEACLSSLNELTGMLTDLHYLVLMDAGELTPAYKQVDLRAQVRTAAQALSGRAAQEGKTISLTEGPSPQIVGAPDLIQRALQNLVAAALRLSKEPAVVVSLEEASGPSARVTIEYRGLSLPLPQGEQAFARVRQAQVAQGFRMDRARGLCLARSAADLHGGEVRYDGVEGGGRLVLTLPYHPRQLASA